jgi:hypothetical protein
MEVKMFIDSNPESAERKLNEWLSAEQIKISHITQSQSERNGNFVFVISVFYTRTDVVGMYARKSVAL